MFGWRYLGGLFVLATLGLNSAGAFGWLRSAPAPSVAHCYPVPLIVPSGWAYSYPATYGFPSAVPLAIPTAAPPSTVEPPLIRKIEMPGADAGPKGSPGPTVIEVRSMNPAVTGLAKDRCRVGFWNLSGRDVTLVIDGKSRLVARDRALTLVLPRDFGWRVDQQPAQTEHVANEKSAHEIVIR
jgi:hypothetical protein